MAQAQPTPQSPIAMLFDSPELRADPYPLYRRLRETTPVLRLPIGAPDAPGVWLLTRHAECQTVLRDARSSVDRRRARIVRENRTNLPAALLGEEGGLRSMLVMDPPDHTRVRGLVSKAFTPRRVASLRERVQEVVGELLWDRARSDRIDLIGELAGPLPAIVIAELLGVPAEDQCRFREWSSELVGMVGGGDPSRDLTARFEKALGRLLDYLRVIVAERRAEPRDDLISAMIQAQEEQDALSDAELLATSNLLLLAGYETTTNLIGNGTLALLRHPDQLERLRDEPALLSRAVEELLRYDSPVQGTARVATETIEIGGHRIAPEAMVVTLIGAANRDPEAFDAPERLDLAREDNRHLSFGFGAHFCLGAPLARLEAEVAFGTLLEAFPDLRLLDDALQYRPSFILRGLRELPLAV